MLRTSVFQVASAFGIASACFLGTPAAHATTLIGNSYANGSETFFISATFTPVVNPVNAGGFTGTFGGNPILFWCADLLRDYSFGDSYNYTATLYVNTNLSRLFTEVGGSVSATTTTDRSAAFQLAIWEILYESNTTAPYNVGTGNFLVANNYGNTAAVALANTWLLNLNVSQPLTTLYWGSNEDRQNFITDTTIESPLLVPEPLPLSLLGVGLLAMILVARRQTTSEPRAGACR
ncbi:MAG: hypothetical protein ABIR52_08300 [Casimicrobiaceae bacterium]